MTNLRRAAWLGAALLAFQPTAREGRDAATFSARVSALERLERQRAEAETAESRGQAALRWLQALEAVLAAIPIKRTEDAVFSAWLDRHDSLVVYSEPSGEWLVRYDLAWTLHDEHRQTTAADDIAWAAATNGLPGECEGYIPCYTSGLDRLYGEYLRRHPDGRHRGEALDRIVESLVISVDDLLKRPDARSYLNVSTDCSDLEVSLTPLRRAVDAVRHETVPRSLQLIDQLASHCRQP